MSAAEDFIISEPYQDKVRDIIWEALMLGLKDDSGTAVWRVGEIVDAMAQMQAMLMATSDMTTSPAKAREWAEAHAKTMRRRIQAFRAHNAQNGNPFEVVHVEGAFN